MKKQFLGFGYFIDDVIGRVDFWLRFPWLGPTARSGVYNLLLLLAALLLFI